MNADVYIVEDSEDLARSTALLLSVHGIAAHTFQSAEDFLSVVECLAPGVVLLDLRLPGLSGIEALPRLRLANGQMRTVILTAHGDIHTAVTALKAGAEDFLLKPYSEEELLTLVRAELNTITRQTEETSLASLAAEKVARLSTREREVVEALVRGYQCKLIAHQLNLSSRTVEMHRARAMVRMQCKSFSELIATAVRGGLT